MYIEKIENIDINKIKRNENQPRKVFNEDELKVLSESIKEFGIFNQLF